MNTTVNPSTRARRQYLVTFGIAMGAYVIVLFLTIWLVNSVHPTGTLRYLLLLAPLVPIGFVVAAILRYFRDCDEFERRVMTESLAIAGGITAIFAVTYAFLESTGLPPLSAWWTWTVVMGAWLVARLALNKRYQ